MGQNALLKSTAGTNLSLPGKSLAFQAKRQSRRGLTVRSSPKSEDNSGKNCNLQAHKTIVQGLYNTTPTVPPAAVDSAVNQIIAVVKVTPVNVV